jgi:DNA-binding IclR family transcriptional regulator
MSLPDSFLVFRTVLEQSWVYARNDTSGFDDRGGGRMSVNDMVMDACVSDEQFLAERSTPASAVSKALTLLELLVGSEGGSATLSELASGAGLPKSSTHRLLRELAIHELVGRVGSRYCVGTRVFEFGLSAKWSQCSVIRDLATPVLEQLYERTHFTVHLAVLEGREIFYLEKITAPNGLGIPSRVGSRMPATCTALGKALLAYSPPEVVRRALTFEGVQFTPRSVSQPQRLEQQLRSVVANGAAIEKDESQLGLSCVAAPIFVRSKLVAAVSVAGYRWPNNQAAYIPIVRDAATEISKRLRTKVGNRLSLIA